MWGIESLPQLEPYEHLYLAKKGSQCKSFSIDEDLCIPAEYASRIVSYQRTDIRFLFKQFINGKPGVILDKDTPKHTQLILFLSTVWILIKPLSSIIICHDQDQVVKWRTLFDYWQQYDHVAEDTNFFSKKRYFICALSDLGRLAQRQWGIVVMDTVDPSALIKHLHGINCKYKVWLTNTDIKKDLPALNNVYQWLYQCKRNISRESTLQIYLGNLHFERLCLSTVDTFNKKLEFELLFEDVINYYPSEEMNFPKEDMNIILQKLDVKSSPVKLKVQNQAQQLEVKKKRVVNNDSEFDNVNAIDRKRSKHKDITGTKIKQSKYNKESNNTTIFSPSCNESAVNVTNMLQALKDVVIDPDLQNNQIPFHESGRDKYQHDMIALEVQPGDTALIQNPKTSKTDNKSAHIIGLDDSDSATKKNGEINIKDSSMDINNVKIIDLNDVKSTNIQASKDNDDTNLIGDKQNIIGLMDYTLIRRSSENSSHPATNIVCQNSSDEISSKNSIKVKQLSNVCASAKTDLINDILFSKSIIVNNSLIEEDNSINKTSKHMNEAVDSKIIKVIPKKLGKTLEEIQEELSKTYKGSILDSLF